jgi:hypothetical protein
MGYVIAAMAFASEFRKKHRKDPRSYPIHWLIRNILMNEFNITSVNPIGPGTKAYNLEMQLSQEMAELDALDYQDDSR